MYFRVPSVAQFLLGPSIAARPRCVFLWLHFVFGLELGFFRRGGYDVARDLHVVQRNRNNFCFMCEDKDVRNVQEIDVVAVSLDLRADDRLDSIAGLVDAPGVRTGLCLATQCAGSG